MIKINQLKYAYPDGTKALHGVDLHVGKNELHAILGKNGSGKSTLLLHLNGIIQGKGSVVVDGVAVSRKNMKQIRQKVGIVFQNPDDMLFSPTVYDDVAFGPRNMGLSEDEVHELVHKALSAVGMEEHEEKNPHHLSLGQKKRVSLAAVLSMNPKIIAFDEPTAYLDPKGRKEIIELICGLKCTKIIATHDLNILKNADMVHIMDGGKIVYSGKEADEAVLERYELV
jgi:cobalt/nickel transport system ATP-binding protein